MKQSSIAIVGLSKLFREGLQVLLRRSRFSVAIQAATLEEALTCVAANRPALLIYAMAGLDNATANIERLRLCGSQLDGIRVVLLTDQLSAENLRDAAATGVQGVLSKDITSEVLQRSLDLAMLGQQFFPGPAEEALSRPIAALLPFSRPAVAPALTPALAPVKSLFAAALAGTAPMRSASLSERERQILGCLVEGAANKTIARELQITEATVKVHIKGLLRKICVSNRTQAAIWGLNNASLLSRPAAPTPDHAHTYEEVRQAAS